MFKKLLTYFLLFNFLNTLCFPDFEVWDGPAKSNFQVSEIYPDEIDSMVEFVAEFCLELGDDFSDFDLDDNPDDLKTPKLLKDYLKPTSLVFYNSIAFFKSASSIFTCRFPVNFFEIDSPPPNSGLV